MKRRLAATDGDQVKDAPAAADEAASEVTVEPIHDVGTVPQNSSPGGRPRPRNKHNRSGDVMSDRVFGLGFVGAGAYGVFGGEVEFDFGQRWAGGFGLGTGIDYSSWGLYSRYYLREERIRTFLQMGYANWYMGKVPPRGQEVAPSFITNRFFEKTASGGFKADNRAHIVYPGIGVFFQQSDGLAAMVQLQYFISATDFSGALFGSLGVYYYF